jgi:NO-binding membrane sensor protein with MHYT domain
MSATDGDRTTEEWDALVVLTSFVLAFMGAYTTVTLAEQHRITGTFKSKIMSQPMYLVLMAISLGAGCIWSMHFVGMSAVQYKDTDNNEIKIEFDLFVTLLSMITCVVFVYAGLYLSSRDKMFSRDREEIYELIIEEGKRDSMAAVRSKRYLLKVALLRGTGPLLLGGVIAGGGVCVMHYIGMMAIHAPLKVHWDAGIVVASVLIAIVAATAAFWILFRALALYPGVESLRLLSSLVAALAVCGMHYTGMAAASYTLDSSPPDPVMRYTISQRGANTVALCIGLLITWVGSMVVQAELRTWHMYLHSRLKVSRKILDQLRARYDSDMMLQDFEAKNQKVVTTFEVDRNQVPIVCKRSAKKVRPSENIDIEQGKVHCNEDELVNGKESIMPSSTQTMHNITNNGELSVNSVTS